MQAHQLAAVKRQRTFTALLPPTVTSGTTVPPSLPPQSLTNARRAALRYRPWALPLVLDGHSRRAWPALPRAPSPPSPIRSPPAVHGVPASPGSPARSNFAPACNWSPWPRPLHGEMVRVCMARWHTSAANRWRPHIGHLRSHGSKKTSRHLMRAAAASEAQKRR